MLILIHVHLQTVFHGNFQFFIDGDLLGLTQSDSSFSFYYTLTVSTQAPHPHINMILTSTKVIMCMVRVLCDYWKAKLSQYDDPSQTKNVEMLRKPEELSIGNWEWLPWKNNSNQKSISSILKKMFLFNFPRILLFIICFFRSHLDSLLEKPGDSCKFP